MYALFKITLSMILGLALHDCRYLIIDSSPSQADMCNGVWPSFWNTENIRFEKFKGIYPGKDSFKSVQRGRKENQPYVFIFTIQIPRPCDFKEMLVREGDPNLFFVDPSQISLDIFEHWTEQNIFENKSTLYCGKKL